MNKGKNTTMVRMIICNNIRNRSAVSALTSIRVQPSNRQQHDLKNRSSSLFNFHTKTIFTFPSTTNVHPVRSLSTITTLSGENDEITHNEAKNNNESKPTIKIVEVGPRDGLQNEALPLVSVKDKLEFVRMLERAGCSDIEVGAFVSPKWVPQMSGSSEVLSGLLAKAQCDQLPQNSSNNSSTSNRSRYSVLVPNLKGLEHALSAGGGPSKKGRGIIDEIAVFGAASEEFTIRNTNSTICESMGRFRAIIDRVREVQRARDNANDRPLLVRGYISTVIACPYQGVIKPKEVAYAVERMLDLGCHEVSLGDTIGVGTPQSTKRMLEEVMNVARPSQLAMHCHDTYGKALVNILAGLEMEIYTIDSAVAGLGGCPYAEGASGNVATEDVLHMLHGMGLSTGIDLEKLLDAGHFICKALGRSTLSNAARALAPIQKLSTLSLQ